MVDSRGDVEEPVVQSNSMMTVHVHTYDFNCGIIHPFVYILLHASLCKILIGTAVHSYNHGYVCIHAYMYLQCTYITAVTYNGMPTSSYRSQSELEHFERAKFQVVCHRHREDT